MMIKVRQATPEEEAEFADNTDKLKEAIAADEIPEGDPEELASHIASGKEVVISEQVKEYLESEGISIDEFISDLLKAGKRIN